MKMGRKLSTQDTNRALEFQQDQVRAIKKYDSSLDKPPQCRQERRAMKKFLRRKGKK